MENVQIMLNRETLIGALAAHAAVVQPLGGGHEDDAVSYFMVLDALSIRLTALLPSASSESAIERCAETNLNPT